MKERKELNRNPKLRGIVTAVFLVLLIIGAMACSKKGKKNDEISKVPGAEQQNEEAGKTPDAVSDDNGKQQKSESMVTKQSSDAKGDKAPVTVHTDGTVDIDELDGYAETKKKDENVSESRIHISSIGSYSGPYIEDGSDENVENILSIVVTNVSEQFLQYSEITMKNGDEKAVFELSNLPAGASALVLAKDRTPAGNGDWIYAEDVTAFIDKAEQYKEKFSWEAGDGFLVLNNKGQKSYSKVYVYYKNTLDGTYVGGITYRIAFDDMQVGESKAKLSKHFDGNNSHVMMIDYID